MEGLQQALLDLYCTP